MVSPLVAEAAIPLATSGRVNSVKCGAKNEPVTLSAAKLAIVAESDLTGRRRAHRRPRARRRDGVGVFEDLKPGMYVVHFHHGVGRYEGMVKRSIGGIERDYLLLAYKGNDKLYVPSDQIDTLRQYVGGEAPTLHRLGGSDFAKAKSRVRSAVAEIAQGLTIDPERVRANLDATGGQIMAEAVTFALARKLGKQEAHHLREAAAKKALKEKRHLEDVLKADAGVTRHLPPAEIEALFDPLAYQGVAQAFIDRLIASTRT